MGARKKLSEGFLSFDALMSLLPIVMIAVHALTLGAMLLSDARQAQADQFLFDHLVSAADYTVKIGLAMESEDGRSRIPNLLDGREPDEAYAGSLARDLGMGRLSISYDEPAPGEHSMCIHRLVLRGHDRQISKLYFCGD